MKVREGGNKVIGGGEGEWRGGVRRGGVARGSGERGRRGEGERGDIYYFILQLTKESRL